MIVDRIECFPDEDFLDDDDNNFKKEDLELYCALAEDDEEKADNVEVVEPTVTKEDPFTSNLLDNTFLDTILYYGCGGCAPCSEGPCQPKSILKKRGAGGYGCYNLNQSRNNVSFSSLEIKEFNMTLGNHPSATSGPPVMIDWDSEASKRVVGLDEYERDRSPRRQRRQLKLSYRDRKGILEQQRGFSTQEVNEAWAEALKIRQQRHETLRRGLVLMTVDDVVESAQRKYRRLAEAVGLA